MANFRGHIAGAGVFFTGYLALIAYVYSINAAYEQFSPLGLLIYPLALLALTLAFGLWPDVDTNSKGQNFFYALFLGVDLFLILTAHYKEAAFLGLFALLPIVGKHRGWTHSWWAMVLIPSPLVVLPYMMFPERPLIGVPFYGAAVVGYLSHLFMDGLVLPMKWLRRFSK